MDVDEMAARVRAIVDAAPPLNPGQQSVIRAMLAPPPRPAEKARPRVRSKSFEDVVRRPAA